MNPTSLVQRCGLGAPGWSNSSDQTSFHGSAAPKEFPTTITNAASAKPRVFIFLMLDDLTMDARSAVTKSAGRLVFFLWRGSPIRPRRREASRLLFLFPVTEEPMTSTHGTSS